jgi:hypothetical protein
MVKAYPGPRALSLGRHDDQFRSGEGIDGQASFIPDRFHTSAPEMLHAIHQVFLVVVD